MLYISKAMDMFDMSQIPQNDPNEDPHIGANQYGKESVGTCGVGASNPALSTPNNPTSNSSSFTST